MTGYLTGVALLVFVAHSGAAETIGQEVAIGAEGPMQAMLPSGAPTRMSLPVIRDGQLRGDVLVDLYPDGQIRYNRRSLIEQLASLIADQAEPEFARRLGPYESLSAEQIAAAGVALRYDPSLLEIHVERIDTALVPLGRLGRAIGAEAPPVTLQPEPFSAYLNVIGDFRLEDFSDFREPSVLLTGAIRRRNFVFEFDGGYDRELISGSGFYRRSARLIYDEPARQRRWSAGDLQLPNLTIIGGTLVGGFGVEKGRRNFLGSVPLLPIGGQQVLLERDATVEVFVDGQQVQTLQLAAGPYDLSQLRAEYSGRNTQLFITDVTGRRQLADFDTYFSAIDLAEGEDEYSAAIGFVPRDFSAQPVYGGMPVFSGYYRRGLTNRFAVGGALQISEDIQLFGAEIVAVPRAIPGRLELSGAVSTGDGSGFAMRGGYTLQFGRALDSQFSITADYRSGRFATLADQIGLPRAETLSVTASFSRSLSERTFLVAGANWFERDGLGTRRGAFVDVIHRTSRFRITAGIEYGEGDFFGRNFGARVAITVPFGRTGRAEAGYNSRRNEFRAFATRSDDDRVGSWGYDIGVRRTSGNAQLDATGTYIGNRFYSRAVVSSAGSGFSNIDDRQFARLQVGTSIAYAGGALAIGRPINDSFIIASPHESMADERVVLGRSIQARRYDAVSGTFGPALGGKLSSYSRQSIIYDLAGGARGYDIGSGIETIEPPYRSGYRLIVGSGATVTAYGFLNLPSGRAELVAGTITSIDDEDFESQPFFTNSTGRFAVGGLRPGKTYQVQLFNPSARYTIAVPANSDSLLQLGEVMIVPMGNGQE